MDMKIEQSLCNFCDNLLLENSISSLAYFGNLETTIVTPSIFFQQYQSYFIIKIKQYQTIQLHHQSSKFLHNSFCIAFVSLTCQLAFPPRADAQ